MPVPRDMSASMRNPGWRCLNGSQEGHSSEIGLAFVPPISNQATSGAYQSLDCMRITDRQRRERGKRYCKFGTVQIIESQSVEDPLSRIFEALSATSKPILIGFAVALELKVLATWYPALTKLFSHWVDLQELASDISILNPQPCVTH